MQEKKHQNEVIIQKENYIIILPEKNKSRHHGIGFVVKKDLKFKISSLDERILNIGLKLETENQKHFNLNILIIYAQTNVREAEKREVL